LHCFGKLRSNIYPFNLQNWAERLFRGDVVVLDGIILIFFIRQTVEYRLRFIYGERRTWVLAWSVEISSDHLDFDFRKVGKTVKIVVVQGNQRSWPVVG
jgi:FtsP/CotA-like multicopper oxidase with cupredoxin domain